MMKRGVGVRRDDEPKWKARTEEPLPRITDVPMLNLNYRIHVEAAKWPVAPMSIYQWPDVWTNGVIVLNAATKS